MEAGSRREPLARAWAPGVRAFASPMFTVQVLTLLSLAGIVVTKYWQEHTWLGWLLLAVAAVAWIPELRARRLRSWWFVYVWGIFAYTLLRALADETAIPIRTDYVIDLDRLLFAGHDPVEVMQRRLFDPDRVNAVDFLAVAVHWSFFIAPHAAAVAIFLLRPKLFPRYVVTMVLTMYLGLLLFFLLPTTPPWLAAQQGRLTDVYRVMDFVGGRVSGDTYRDFYASLGEPNSVAAMPSIHMAVTFAMYLWARTHAPRLALPAAIYCLLMGLALAYMAEHYLLDMLVGAALAFGCYAASGRLIARLYPARAPAYDGRDDRT